MNAPPVREDPLSEGRPAEASASLAEARQLFRSPFADTLAGFMASLGQEP